MFDLSSPTVYIPVLFLIIVVVLLLYCMVMQRKIHGKTQKTSRIITEIGLSMHYIYRNILENGRFQYRNHVNPEIEYENTTYNALRHAGVLYSLYMYEKYGLEKKYHEARVKASKYFIDRYIKN